MDHPKVTIVSHALVQHKLTILRDRHTDFAGFRRVIRELGLLMGAEVTRTLPLLPERVETPVLVSGEEIPAVVEGAALEDRALVIVPVLRAGLTMAEALHELVPTARSGHLGLYREGAEDVITYLISLPVEPATRFISNFVIVDPIIATGKTLCRALALIQAEGIGGRQIRVMSLVAASAGLERVYRDPANSEVQVFVAAVDRDLDPAGYVVPGLGDAGDRQFGTLKPRSLDQHKRKDIR